MKFVPSLFCSALMAAAMLNSSVRAEVSTPPVTPPDCCTAPSGTVTAYVYDALPDGVYYGTVVINGVSNAAWCLRPDYYIFPAPDYYHPGSRLYSTCEPYLGATLTAINQGPDLFFNGVSGATQQKFVALDWIINNRTGYNASQVQAAIWIVLYNYMGPHAGMDFPGGAPLATAALQYGATHASYNPTCAKIGWVLQAPPQALDGITYPQQLMLLEVPCPEPATIGDKVWIDANKNGIQDGGEAALPNVTVNLYACVGNNKVLDSTGVTDANGIYGFTVQPGSYSVEFVLPSGYVFTTSNVGADDAKDSDADSATGSTACVTVGCGEKNLTVDAGAYIPCAPATIGDKVWVDTNKNGVQDNGETGLAGVTVKLFACGSAAVLSTKVTAQNGAYSFTGLEPGSYFVQFVLPSGYAFTSLNVGNDNADSDAGAGGVSDCVTVVCGGNNTTIDAGVTPVYSNPGTGTPGYWKNHTEAWPVSSIVIGGVTYTKTQALEWLGRSDKQDKRVTLFRALLCAKLNVVIGNDSSCISTTIGLADAWWAAYKGAAVPASTYPWQAGKGGEYATKLDNYNNGLLCAPHRN